MKRTEFDRRGIPGSSVCFYHFLRHRLSAAAMQCPTCKETRYKASWRPSQWGAWSARVEDEWGQIMFEQCKHCDAARSRSCPSRSPSPSATCPRRPAGSLRRIPRPIPHQEDVPEEASWLVAALTSFSTVAFGDFVREWMHLPYQMRKLCSHSGAILARCDSDPVHYICPREGLRYFDPTNWVYAQALQLLCPELMAEVNWNLVTKGDVCESILGMDFVWRHGVSAFLPRNWGLIRQPLGGRREPGQRLRLRRLQTPGERGRSDRPKAAEKERRPSEMAGRPATCTACRGRPRG